MWAIGGCLVLFVGGGGVKEFGGLKVWSSVGSCG